MTSKTVRKVIFGLHRYIGLAVGLIAIAHVKLNNCRNARSFTNNKAIA